MQQFFRRPHYLFVFIINTFAFTHIFKRVLFCSQHIIRFQLYPSHKVDINNQLLSRKWLMNWQLLCTPKEIRKECKFTQDKKEIFCPVSKNKPRLVIFIWLLQEAQLWLAVILPSVSAFLKSFVVIMFSKLRTKNIASLFLCVWEGVIFSLLYIMLFPFLYQILFF